MDIASMSVEEIRKKFTIEYCPICDKETIIYAKGVTRCQYCHHALIPCSVCEKCTLSNEVCPYLEEVNTDDADRIVNNPDLNLSEEDIKKIYSSL